MSNEDIVDKIVMTEILRIPSDRIGVLIGRNGATKSMIEELTSTILVIDGEDNSVAIKPKKNIEDISKVWIARDIVKAIGRGFSEKIAIKLADPSITLRIISLEGAKAKKRAQHIRGRIIGENGKTRRILEQTTKVYISIYGNTISIIGSIEGAIEVAQEAIEMLIQGAKHSTVYKYLEKYRIQKKAEAPKIWQVREETSFERMWQKFEQEIRGKEKEQPSGPIKSQTEESNERRERRKSIEEKYFKEEFKDDDIDLNDQDLRDDFGDES